MFNKPAETVPTVQTDAAPPVNLIPLSHLGLDLGVPGEGWPTFLGRRAIVFVPDDLGRDCVRRQDARRLLDEQRADELRAAKRRKVAEAEAVEADQRRFAQIWTGLSADAIPAGAHPATAMLEAAQQTRPKRTTPLEEALSGESMVYHTLPKSEDES